MPQPPRNGAGVARGTQGTPNDALTAQEQARVEASILGKEQAPSTREQTTIVNWRQVFDALGDPHMLPERLPLTRARQVRLDPMVAFGLNFMKAPIIKAQWHIHCEGEGAPPAQVAQFIDDCIRPIHADLMYQILQSLEYGFQAIAKRFEPRTPGSFWIDPENGNKNPTWSEGSIQPMMLKPFVPLEPETVQPVFNKQTGEFEGINWKPPQGVTVPGNFGAKRDAEGNYNIDLYHSLWVSNDRAAVGGNLFGRSRLVHVYKYWWSYWFRWAIADRAFEKKGDPSVVVRFPDGWMTDPRDGTRMPNREWALLMGERVRSGSVVALPSEPHEGGLDDKLSSIPKWSLEYVKDALDFDPFDESFDYLDIQKLRGLWIPEQALVEGRGGTSSRNVASTFGDFFVSSQGIQLDQANDIINRFIIPHLVMINFPEFRGIVEKRTKGFDSDDIDFAKQIIQLLGQSDNATALAEIVDVEEVLKMAGTPLLSPEQQEEQKKKMLERVQAENAPPPVDPTASAAGVVPVAQNGNGGGPAFSYIDNVPHFEFAQSAEFVADLPPIHQYRDKAVRGQMRSMWNLWRDTFSDQYGDFVSYLEGLEEDEEEEGVEASVSKDARERAEEIVAKWDGSLETLTNTVNKTQDIIGKIVNRAASIETRKAKLEKSPSEGDLVDWATSQTESLGAKINQTVRRELTDFIAKALDEGDKLKDIPNRVRDHFLNFPEWKSSRVVRDQAREAYNAATLLAADTNGYPVQLKDAQYGDTDDECMERDGEIMEAREAMDEEEHPYGTLGFEILTKAPGLTTSYVDGLPEGVMARYDKDNNAILFSSDIGLVEKRAYMRRIGEALR